MIPDEFDEVSVEAPARQTVDELVQYLRRLAIAHYLVSDQCQVGPVGPRRFQIQPTFNIAPGGAPDQKYRNPKKNKLENHVTDVAGVSFRTPAGTYDGTKYLQLGSNDRLKSKMFL